MSDFSNVFDIIPHKVKIPLDLFTSTVSLLDDLDIDDLSPDIIPLFSYVRFSLKKIQNRLDLRAARTRLLLANTSSPGLDTSSVLESCFSDDDPF